MLAAQNRAHTSSLVGRITIGAYCRVGKLSVNHGKLVHCLARVFQTDFSSLSSVFLPFTVFGDIQESNVFMFLKVTAFSLCRLITMADRPHRDCKLLIHSSFRDFHGFPVPPSLIATFKTLIRMGFNLMPGANSQRSFQMLK